MSEYLVSYEPIDNGGDPVVAFKCLANKLPHIIDYMKTRGNGKTILVAKIHEKVCAKVDITYAHYEITDKGEVIPK